MELAYDFRYGGPNMSLLIIVVKEALRKHIRSSKQLGVLEGEINVTLVIVVYKQHFPLCDITKNQL